MSHAAALGWAWHAARLGQESTGARRAWRTSYVRRLVLGDLVCAALAGLSALLVRFGPEPAQTPAASTVAGLALPSVWLGSILIARAYEERFLWVGAEEFRRVFFAAMMLLATLATASWAFRLDVARGFVVLAVPMALSLTLAHRCTQRLLLHRARRRGERLQTTLLVGHRNAVAALGEQLVRESFHGYRVIGCCLPEHQYRPAADAFHGLPILGDLTAVAATVRLYKIDTVAVLPCPELDGAALRRLGWALEKTDAELLLAPAVTEIVGTRVRIRPVCGLPLMHMERPELAGIRRLGKSLFDKVAAGIGVLVLIPVLVGLAVAVKATSRGPVLYRQERVGRDGQTFSMLKFRSMVVGADRMVDDLSAETDGNGVLFKKRDDPRVTPIGRIMRRYSLDELPQLLNVLRGSMSLVGPRPPLPTEVEKYGFDMHRRFLVKPGLTGLWQFSGRSDLSWDDSVRLDVRYVENWSLTFDFMILWKTVAAVWRGSGAY
nr:sugar transferase [Blastococcus aurantiacus]